MSDVVEQPVVEEPVAPPQEPAAPEPPADPDAAELAELEANAVVLPDGAEGLGKYVPLSAATTARDEAKRLRGEGKTLKAELEQAKAAAAAAAPYVEAAKVLLQQQPQAQQPQSQGPSPEERAELEEVARDLDFYKTDGSLDFDRASRHQARILKAAEKIAAQQVAPMQHDAALSKAQAIFATAREWKHPISGEQVDPEILKASFNKVYAQKDGLATLTNQDAVAVIWADALLKTQLKKGPQAPAAPRTPAPDGPPMFVETSGGGGGQERSLSSHEKQAAQEMGMSEAEYLKEAAKRPRG